MNWALFAAEFEISKILVHRLPQGTSNVNIGCPGKSKRLHYLQFPANLE